jgi:hypothetical protein
MSEEEIAAAALADARSMTSEQFKMTRRVHRKGG